MKREWTEEEVRAMRVAPGRVTKVTWSDRWQIAYQVPGEVNSKGTRQTPRYLTTSTSDRRLAEIQLHEFNAEWMRADGRVQMLCTRSSEAAKTVDHACTLFRQHVEARGKRGEIRPATVEVDETYIRRVEQDDVVRRLRLDDPRMGEALTQFVARLETRGNSSLTVHRTLHRLGQALELAAKHGWCGRDVLYALPAVEGRANPGVRAVRRDVAQQILWHCAAGRAYEPRTLTAMVALMFGGGLRRAEVMRAVPCEDIDLRARRLIVRQSKTGADGRDWFSNPIPITDTMRPWLELVLAIVPQGGFPQDRRWEDAPREVMTRAVAKLGFAFPSFSPNDCRRSFCTWHWEDGLSYELLAKLMRHTTTAMVQRHYARPGIEATQRLIDEHYARRAGPPAEVVSIERVRRAAVR